MHHDKIIKREDGTKIRISVNFWLSGSSPVYTINITTMLRRKRTWLPVGDTDSYQYRRLDIGERKRHLMAQYLQIVSGEEIQQARLECWEKLKPVAESSPLRAESAGWLDDDKKQ